MDQWKAQKAIIFLVSRMAQMSLSKPAIIHGVRAGFQTAEWQGSEKAILGSYLHDVLEDTEASFDEIKQEFGEEVAKIVEANTLTLEDRELGQQGIERIIEKCLAIGEDAVMVKAADIIDNSRNYQKYFPQEKWEREKNGLEMKRKIFLEKCKEFHGHNFYKDVKNFS